MASAHESSAPTALDDHHRAAEPFDADELDSALSRDAALISLLRTAVADTVKGVPDADEYWRSDHALHRFLVARNMNVESAAKMYTAVMAHRHARSSWLLLETYRPPAVMRNCFPWGFTGFDRQGFPVLVEKIGAVDLVGLEGTIGTEAFLDWVCWYHEVQERAMRRQSAKLGRNRHKMTCIIDLGGLQLRGLSATAIGVIKRRARLEEVRVVVHHMFRVRYFGKRQYIATYCTTQLYAPRAHAQDNYPEVVKRVFLINTPVIFSAVWSIVKHFVDEGTRDKMRLLGTDYLPTLTKFIDPSAIPAYLGGELRDVFGEAECLAMVAPGGVVPHAYAARVADDGCGCGEEVTVPAGRHSDVVICVPAGATVRWRWGGAHGADAAVDFSVRVAPAATSTQLPVTVTRITSSTLGVHQLTPEYTGPVRHGMHSHAVPRTDVTPSPRDAPLVGAAPGASERQAVHPARSSSASGSEVVPSPSIVRFRWDNAHSWLHSKLIVRRIDVLLAGDEWSAARRENDPAEVQARARDAHIETFGT